MALLTTHEAYTRRDGLIITMTNSSLWEKDTPTCARTSITFQREQSHGSACQEVSQVFTHHDGDGSPSQETYHGTQPRHELLTREVL